MQRDHAKLFTSPPLPASKIRSMSAFDMGNFTKFFCSLMPTFGRVGGSNGLSPIMTMTHPRSHHRNFTNTAARRDPMEFHDIDALVPGSNTLFTYVTGADCDVWSTMTDEEASAALVSLLRRHFPSVGNFQS